MDDDGNILPPGEAGEICVRGALVSQEYFEMPEATAEVRTFGWHHTGDVGRFSEDGYLFIVDRKKDMVVTGGFNVFTAEVEAAIMELDAVRECAVIGMPHEHWGEAVHAVVVADGDRRSGDHRPRQGAARRRQGAQVGRLRRRDPAHRRRQDGQEGAARSNIGATRTGWCTERASRLVGRDWHEDMQT